MKRVLCFVLVMIMVVGHLTMSNTPLTNYGTQNHNQLSSDFVGFCTEYMEKNGDCLVAFFMGASGNLDPYSRIAGEAISDSSKEYGQELGKQALAAQRRLQRIT